jgi:Flp pilus assembly pilin Flp
VTFPSPTLTITFKSVTFSLTQKVRCGKFGLTGAEMKSLFTRLWKEDSGQDLVEYALLLAFFALALVATIPLLASSINSVFDKAAVVMTDTSKHDHDHDPH